VARGGLRLALVAAVVVCSCAPTVVQPPSGVDTKIQPGPAAVAAKRALDASRAPAASHRVASISRNAIGPFIARSRDSAIAAWIVAAEKGGGQEIIVVPIADDGLAAAQAQVVATVQEATNLVVRAAGGPRGGWLLAWSALLDRGESITALGLTRDGTPRGSPVDVGRTSDHIAWCDVIATSHGSIGVWAEETGAGAANMLAIALGSDGKPAGMPVRVARAVDGWQAVAFDDGVGLALLNRDARGDRASAARVSWLRLDAQAHPRGEPIAVGSRPTVTGDIDAVALPEGALLAWTDRTGEDAQVMLALVDTAGHVTGPVAAMDAVGGSSLVALASGAKSAALAWEEPSARAHPLHPLHIASVSTGARLGAQPISSVEVAPGMRPELAATAEGFALLASAHACMTREASAAALLEASASTPRDSLVPRDAPVSPVRETSTSCGGPVVPTFVRFDGQLTPVQAEPVLLEDGSAAALLGWALRCSGDRCLALAATGEAPTPVFAVDFEVRTSPFAIPSVASMPPDAPRVTSLETLASGQPYEDVAAGKLGDVTLVVALASAVGASDGDSRHPNGGVLTVRTLGADGRQQGPTATLTSRAASVGGIALAPAATPQDGAAVAWVTGRGDQERQLHVAHLDGAGHRSKEIELTTRAKGDVSSVAMAWTGDGWLVAWVDARDGNGEVYATKIDRDLTRVAREERITNSPGDAGDVALAVRGSVAWLAWSDPRESPREGLGDIYATTLHIHDAKRASDEVRVLASAPHSRSPQIAPIDGNSAVIAWIEDVATGLEGPAAAMAAVIDRDAHVVRTPAILPLAGAGRPTAIALDPTATGARAIVVRSNGESLTLDALFLGADAAVENRPWPLLDVEAPASFDVAVAIAGDALVFDDVGTAPGDHHVRRAAVRWMR
jgi:hypothetical protein